MEAEGPTPAGVDWSSAATQELRFLQLLQVCDFRRPCTLNDLGCGYGALRGYLARHQPEAEVDYLGIDLSKTMIAHARELWRGRPHTRFRVGRRSPRVADYSVASGIFNVKLAVARVRWEEAIRLMLRELHAASTRGFAVNFLAPQPLHLSQPRQLYRCDPAPWLDYCADKLQADVRLAGGYGLNEYTLLIQRR